MALPSWIHKLKARYTVSNENRRIGRGYFDPPLWMHLLIILLAVTVGILFYSTAVRFCYVMKYRAVAAVDIFHPSLPAVPRMPDQLQETETESKPALLLAHLQQLGLYSGDKFSVAKKKASFQYIADILLNGKDKNFFDIKTTPTCDIKTTPTVYWIARLTQGKPITADDVPYGPNTVYDDNTQARLKNPNEANANLVTAIIAGYPNTLKAWNEFINNYIVKKKPSHTEEKALKDTRQALIELVESNCGNFGGIMGVFSGFDTSVESYIVEPQVIIATLWRANAVNMEYLEPALIVDENRKSEPKSDIARPDKMNRQDVLEIEKVIASMISKIQSSTNVKRADWWMSLVHGWPQLLMFIVALWTLGVLAARGMGRRRQDQLSLEIIYYMGALDKVIPYSHDLHKRSLIFAEAIDRYLNKAARFSQSSLPRLMLEICRDLLRSGASVDVLRYVAADARSNNASSRWLLTWLGRALPALGFLGTVVGISLALGNADSIVRAETVVAQAAAIQSVSASLGVAFMTTLVALLFGLVLTYLSDKQGYRERRLIAELEQVMIDVIDPARRPSLTGASIPTNFANPDPRSELVEGYELRLKQLKGGMSTLLLIFLSVIAFIYLYWVNNYLADPMSLVQQIIITIHVPDWNSVRPLLPGLFFVLLLIVTTRSVFRWAQRLNEKNTLIQILNVLQE